MPRWQRRVVLVALAVALVLVWNGWRTEARADGSDVAQSLGGTPGLVGQLTGTVGPNGAYGDQPNAEFVPFLGDDPTQNLPGVFDALNGLGSFAGFDPADDADVSVIAQKVQEVDVALGPGEQLSDPTPTLDCGGPCAGKKVVDVQSIRVRLTATGAPPPDSVDFEDLGLPSISFLSDGGSLNVNLSWTATVDIVAEAGRALRLEAVPEEHELAFTASITLPVNPFEVNLGVLIVQATPIGQPTFSGTIGVDFAGDQLASPTFSFDAGAGFDARFALATTADSPLKGISAELHIAWQLAGAGVSSDGLLVEFDKLKIDAKQLLGEDLDDALSTLRDIVHPIRTATSPLVEPIPGLSDLSELLGAGKTSFLDLGRYAAFTDPGSEPPNQDFNKLRDMIEKIILIDNGLALFDADDDPGDADVGKFTLAKGAALQTTAPPVLSEMQSIVEECDPCKAAMDKILGLVGGEGSGPGGFSFDFPVLDDPASLAGLLLGRDVDLITFDTGRLGPDEEIDIPLFDILVFSVQISGDIEASMRLQGGVDTRGIIDALNGGGVADVINGLYLQNPGDGPVARFEASPALGASVLADFFEIRGGPKALLDLTVPPAPSDDNKLRPALVGIENLGCKLLEGPDAAADIGVRIESVIDYLVAEDITVLAEHQFLTRHDLCSDQATGVKVAELDGNGALDITTATARQVPATDSTGQAVPDTVTVYAKHDDSGAPTHVVVSVNDNLWEEFPADQVTTVRYESKGDNRPVLFRALKTDGKPFEKKIDVETADGDDDVFADTQHFATVSTAGGKDKIIVTAGTGGAGSIIRAGTGDDYLLGGPNSDLLGGEEDNDTIDGGGGRDDLSGGPGDDTLLDSSVDANCLVGGTGNDRLFAGKGADHLLGDDGVILFVGCATSLEPEDAGDEPGGKDYIVTGGGADQVWAGNADDIVRVLGDAPTTGDPAVPDTDPLYDAAVTVHGHGGNDDIATGAGADVVHGGPGDDTIVAGEGDNTVHGGLGKDAIHAGGGSDDIFGDNGADSCKPPIAGQPAETDAAGGDDAVSSLGGVDYIALEAGADIANSGDGDDYVCGHAGDDRRLINGVVIGLLGGDGDDHIYGGSGNDETFGSAGSDDIFGNDGTDGLHGDDGDDRMVGGSDDATTPDSGTASDGFGDHVFGGAGHDVMAGDNASITPQGAVTLLAETTIGQADQMWGDGGNDRLYGEKGNDELHGGDGDDQLEGNAGSDEVFGEGGQDDLIGGTSESADGAADSEGDQPDVGDTLDGGASHDVIAGDNAAITRFGTPGAWTSDDLVDRPGTAGDVLGVVRRRVELFDMATTSDPAADAGFSGADHIVGGDGHDIAYGQGGADELQGGGLDDYLEGGAGNDSIYGQGGQDDVIGGTGRQVSDAPGSAVDGRLDGAETLFGDDDPTLRPLSNTDDFDVVVGDNATVVRSDPFFTGTTGDAWVFNSFNASITRTLFLYDVGMSGAPAEAGTFGDDVLYGQSADDVLYGQGGDDVAEGSDGDDYMEGNEGSDTLRGENGNDDIVGGTGRINDDPATGTDGRLESAETLTGGPGFDVIAGDNAIVRRTVGSNGEWLANTFNGGVQHERIQLLDMASISNPEVPADVSGDDDIAGNEDDDLVYGQGGDDSMNGNDGDDYMEGNAGADVMEGDANQDDMIGGTGRVNQDPATGGNGRFDDDDLMYGADVLAGEGGDGGDDYDVMVGDNAVIERPLTPLPEGDWIANTFNDGTERTVVMLDLELASQPVVDGRVHGDDTMFGNGDDDLMRGQGGDDTMHGNDGDDDMEGNPAVDHMFGDAQQDDMLGGSRVAGRRDAGDFLYGGADHDTVLGDNALIVRPLTPLPAGDWQVQDYGHVFGDEVMAIDQQRVIRHITNLDSAIGLTSGSDVVHGQAGDDDLYGQLDDTGDTNDGAGAVPVQESCDMGPLTMPNDPFFTGEPTGPFSVAGDLVCGGVGEDAILGDQGVVTSFVERGNQVVLTHNGAPFITETSRVEGSLARKVVLQGITVGGADVLLGDDPTNRVVDGTVPAGLGAHDSIHGGAGADIANGHHGDDFLFGDDGRDALWGGDHDDHAWGGYEEDHIDVLPRTAENTGIPVGDPISWFFFAPDDPDTVDDPTTEAREGYDGYRGFDIIYGGWHQDAMQANEGDNGPVEGDRLVDWVGAFNAYYLCPATFGEYVSTRQMSPSLLLYLQQQAEADGASNVTVGTRTSGSGFNELALVYKKDIRANANPTHPDTPGHFTCR